jgi:hypothetical protein
MHKNMILLVKEWASLQSSGGLKPFQLTNFSTFQQQEAFQATMQARTHTTSTVHVYTQKIKMCTSKHHPNEHQNMHKSSSIKHQQ